MITAAITQALRQARTHGEPAAIYLSRAHSEQLRAALRIGKIDRFDDVPVYPDKDALSYITCSDRACESHIVFV